MSLYVENEFISSILEGKLTFEQINKQDFEIRSLKYNAELYEWLLNYWQTNGNLPTDDLIKVRYPLFQKVEIKDKSEEILDGIKEGTRRDRFEIDMRQAIKLWKDSGDVDKIIEFLSKKFNNYERKSNEDLFELTSEDFIFGKNDFLERKAALEGLGRYGISTGFGNEFDVFLNGGWQKGDLYGLVGITGVGKTWLKTVSAARGAFLNGYNVLDVSLEGNISREYYRLLTVVNETSNSALQSGALSLDEFEWSEKKFREYKSKKNAKYWLQLFGNREIFTPNILRQRLQKLIDNGEKLDLVCIDYLTLMSSEDGKMEWNSFIEVASKLSNISATFQIPLLIILQSGDFDNGSDMTLNDIAQSKGLSRPFSSIFGFSKVKGKENIGKLDTLKTRDGVGRFTGYFRSNWNSGLFKFESYADQEDTF